MIIYCDTSVLVSAISAEQFSVPARDWLDQRPRASLAFSGWTEAEIASALARKQRAARIDAADRARSLAIWHEFAQAMTRTEVTPEDFASVARLVDSGARGLRASDALHLAVVLRLGLSLATFDRDLASAAQAEGVAVAFGPPDA